MTSSVRLSRWGNSLGVRLPKHVVDALGLKPGNILDISLDENRVILRPTHKYSLKELVSKITEENRHPETDWGPDVGKERW